MRFWRNVLNALSIALATLAVLLLFDSLLAAVVVMVCGAACVIAGGLLAWLERDDPVIDFIDDGYDQTVYGRDRDDAHVVQIADRRPVL